MANISSHIHFNGNTEEAFEFYRSIFGGAFTRLLRFKDLNNPDFKNVFAERLKKITKSATILVVGQVPMVKTPAEYENLFRKYLVALSLRSAGIPAVAPSVEVESANEKIAEIVAEIDRPNIFFFNPYPKLIDKTPPGHESLFCIHGKT